MKSAFVTPPIGIKELLSRAPQDEAGVRRLRELLRHTVQTIAAARVFLENAKGDEGQNRVEIVNENNNIIAKNSDGDAHNHIEADTRTLLGIDNDVLDACKNTPVRIDADLITSILDKRLIRNANGIRESMMYM